MHHIPQSHLTNPGVIPLMKAHVGFPLLSGTKLGMGNSSMNYLTLTEIFDSGDNDYEMLFNEMGSGTTRLSMNAEIRALNVGFRIGKGYIHLDVGDVVHMSSTLDRRFAQMLWDVEQNQLQNQNMETTYDLGAQDINGLHYRSYSVGYARQILPNLSAGMRIRYLQGIFNIWSINNGLTLRYPGVGTQFEVDNQWQLLSSGLANIENADIMSLAFPEGNRGFAFDFGGTYQITDDIELGLSLLNIGQINWDQGINEQIIGNNLTFSAVNIEENEETWGDVIDNLFNSEPAKTALTYTTPLPLTINLSGNYYFSPNASVGLILNSVNYNRTNDIALAVVGNYSLGKILGLTGSIMHHRYHPITVGAGISLDIGAFQLYALSENVTSMFNWESTQSIQAQVGINFNFGKMLRGTSSHQQQVIEYRLEKNAKITQASTDTTTVVNSQVEDSSLHVASPYQPHSPHGESREKYTVKLFSRDFETYASLIQAEIIIYKFKGRAEKEQILKKYFDDHVIFTLDRTGFYEIIIHHRGHVSKNIYIKPDDLEDQVTLAKIDVDMFRTVKSNDTGTKPKLSQDKKQAILIPLDAEEEASIPIPVAQNSPSSLTRESEPLDNSEDSKTSLSSAETFFELTGATKFRGIPEQSTIDVLTLIEGDRVKVIDKPNRKWWIVDYNNQIGMLKAKFLKPVVNE